MKRLLKISLISLLALSTSGCVSLLLGGGNTPPRYTLKAVDAITVQKHPLDVKLIIDDPQSEAAFDTASIAFASSDLRYEYFTTGEWSDRAPRLFGIQLERSFQNSGAFSNVGDRTTLAVGDYILQTDMRNFHMVRKDSTMNISIAYYAKLTDRKGEALGARMFAIEKPTGGTSLSAAIPAFNMGLSQVSQETVKWAHELIERDLSTREPDAGDAAAVDQAK